MMDTVSDWQVSVHRVFIGVFVGMLMMLAMSILNEAGNILSSGMTSLFLSYIVYSMSQVNSMETMKENDSVNARGALVQFAVILIILLSIPPTMADDNGAAEGTDKGETGGSGNEMFGQSSKVQSSVMVVMLLILTHVLQLWIDLKSVSVNLFWYRLGEGVLTVVLYQYGVYRAGTEEGAVEYD